MFKTSGNKDRIKNQVVIFIDKECIKLPDTKFSNINSTDNNAKIFKDINMVDNRIDVDLAIS